LLQRYGTRAAKERLWDGEFASGRWDVLDAMAGDCLYPYVEGYAGCGRILDLGCGPGATGNELAEGSYTSYTGVDISEVAVEKARRRSAQNRRASVNEFRLGDIITFVPERSYDVIILGDSIYYIARNVIPGLLKRYARFLLPGGVFVVRIRGPYPDIVAMIERDFSVVRKEWHYYREICVLVFRPRTVAEELRLSAAIPLYLD
jgi:2-polyprenyl-6-hydroxyphenyl methylase/3-demethylubiquinone-9 3-methyltransferase